MYGNSMDRTLPFCSAPTDAVSAASSAPVIANMISMVIVLFMASS